MGRNQVSRSRPRRSGWSSHTMKRFFGAFRGSQNWGFRRVLQQLFVWRLKLDQPKAVILGIDAMVMDNDEGRLANGYRRPTRR